jgi:putative endonuclease
MDRQPATYILTTNRNGTLYVGVTSDLIRRIWQHRDHLAPGFTNRYNVTRIVWYELHDTMENAITREKQLKKWNRAWKIRLIEESNPYWNDLWPYVSGQEYDTGSPPSRG